MSHTPGPWVLGTWTIHDEDREAQKRGEPYWTLTPRDYDAEVCQGPFGRKVKNPEYITQAVGYEADGISASDGDMRLICAAPDLLAALSITRGQWIDSVNADQCLAALAKAGYPQPPKPE